MGSQFLRLFLIYGKREENRAHLSTIDACLGLRRRGRCRCRRSGNAGNIRRKLINSRAGLAAVSLSCGARSSTSTFAKLWEQTRLSSRASLQSKRQLLHPYEQHIRAFFSEFAFLLAGLRVPVLQAD